MQRCSSVQAMSNVIIKMWKCQRSRQSSKRCKRRAATSDSVIKKSIGQMVTGGSIRDLTNKSLRNSRQNVFVFSGSVLCLGGKCADHLEAARIREKDRISHFVERLEYRQPCDLSSEPVEFVWRMYLGEHQLKSSSAHGGCLRKKTVSRLKFKDRIIFVNVQRHQLVARQERKRLPSKRNTCCFVRQSLQTKTMVISRP